MQFQVPQFIEVEDKIFGPLTFRQFIYLAGGAGACYLLWRLLPLLIAGPLVIAIGGSALALAFFQYNGRPFIIAVENAFFYFFGPKFYLWDNARRLQKKDQVLRMQDMVNDVQTYVPKLSESKLRSLAWSLDIKERVAAGIARDEERGTDSVMPPSGSATPRESSLE